MGTYSMLADTMARHPAMQIFRRFSALNLRSVLYYEAELVRLQDELVDIEKLDRESDEMPRKIYGRSWLALTAKLEPVTGQPNLAGSSKAATPGTSIYSRQWDLMCRIRTVLEAYYQALQWQVEVENGCSQPRPRDLDNLREWHRDGRYGKGFLLGTSEDVWDTENDLDLQARDLLIAADTGDVLSYSISGWVMRLRRNLNLVGQAATTGLRRFKLVGKSSSASTTSDAGDPAVIEKQASGSEIRSLTANGAGRVTAGVLTVLTSVLLVLPILVLYLVDRLAVKVGLVFVFTVIMAAVTTFGLSMNAEKVLTITTAFAAVQVVFIATNNNT